MLAALVLRLALGAAPVDEWRPVLPGVEYRTFVVEPKPRAGDGLAHVVRIDPAVAKLDVGLASENDGTLRTAKEWCVDRGFAVVINAGMYGTDYVSNVGYLRRGKHLNNGAWSAKYQAVLGLGARQKGLPAAQLWDRDASGDALAAKYEVVVQNLRLLKAPGVNVWKPNGQAWSEAAIATDEKGHVYFILVRTPFEVSVLNERLLALPLGLTRAMHVEGGPEASLSIVTRDFELHLAGGPRTPIFSEQGMKQWRIPNVVGVRAR
ncbi:MAG: phosphodiester glycosidase family protein [Myxococcota bacterium]